MRTVYLDADFRCHVSDSGGLTALETDFFDGKCGAYVEGYRLVPAGRAWTRKDGKVFYGEMAAPWQDYGALCAAQAQYEAMSGELAQARRENESLLADMASLVEEVYQSDLELMTE